MSAPQETSLIVVDRPGCRARHVWTREPSRVLRSFEAVCAQLERPRRHHIWVALHEESAHWLGRALASLGSATTDAPLLLFCPVTCELLSALYSGFKVVVAGAQAALAPDELRGVLRTAHPGDYCVAAAFHAAEDHVVLWRGDFTSVVLALEPLRAEKAGSPVEPERLAILDHGQTIALGAYELSVDALLYERDPKYRRRANARRLDRDDSLGGCLRRLRLLRRVPRDGFQGLSEKTIARIERGEVTRPHERTLNRIANRLGVNPDEILSY